MSALATIHIAKKQLGLDDDTYRAVLVRVTGKGSSRDMTESERQAVVADLERLGFQRASKAPGRRGKPLSGPYGAKLQALWIAGWNLGLVHDRRDAALVAFVRRQTGIERTDWLRDPADAKKAVEALKAWLHRDGGVDWSAGKGKPAHAGRHGYQIAAAQWRKLHPESASLAAFWAEVSIIIKRAIVVEKPSDAEWIKVMNDLGTRIRVVERHRAVA